MRINHNIAALNTHNQLSKAFNKGTTSAEKLSSGLRINRAGDDAAGLAISEKMRGQIRGLSQASRNAQDGISLIQTAEGAASVVHDMLQRGRELAVQAVNDTLTDNDRVLLNDELTQLKKQITKVANDTEFNMLKLLNQGAFSSSNASLIATIKDRLANWIDDSLTVISNNIGLNPSFVGTREMTVEFYEDPFGSAAASMGTSDGGNSLTLRINMSAVSSVYNSADDGWGQVDALIAHEIVHALQFTEMDKVFSGGVDTWFIEGLATTIQGGVPFLQALAGDNSDASIPSGSTWTGDYGSAYAAAMTLHEITTGGLSAIVDRLQLGETLDQALANTTQGNVGEFSSGVADFTTTSDFTTWFNSSTDVDDYLNNSTDFDNPIGTINATQGSIRSGVTTLEGIITNNATIENGSPFNLTYADSEAPASTFTFQIGANAGQTIQISSVDISSEGLAINSSDLSNRKNASDAIGILDAAIGKVSTIRGTYGAAQNRLEHTIKNLNNSEENLTSAESRIRDVDMAREMMMHTKQAILTQAAQAMLAKANQKPQSVLQLLQ